MQGYDPYRHVAPYSSSSNLSPLAPPFTVEPSFLGSAHDDQHYAYSTRPPSHDNWLQLNSQAYESNNLFLNPNPVVTSPPTENANIDPVSAYGQSMSNNFFSPPSGNWPYHPQYPPASFDGSGSNTSFDVNEHRSVLWGAKSDSEPWKAKGKDANVSASPSYASLVNQGIFSNDGFGFSAREEPSRVWPEKPVESLAENLVVGSRETKSPVGKLSSKSKEKSRDTPFDMSRINPAPFKEMSYNITPSPDFAMESWTQLTPGIPSYGRFFTGGDSYRSDPLCFYPASSKSSLDQIHESPAISGKPTMLTSRSALTSYTSPIEPPRDAWQRKEVYTWDIPSNMGRSRVMDEISDCYVGPSSNNGVEEYVDPLASSVKSTTITTTNLLTSTSPIERHRDVRQKKGGSVVDSSSSMGCGPGMAEISESYGGTRCINNGVEEYVGPRVLNDVVPQLHSPAPTADPLRHLAKAENNGQVTEFNLPGTLLTADSGVGDSVDCSSEVTEQFNPGVDSPCWKGASDSRYSLFGASDVGAADTPAKILEGCGTLNIQGLQELPVNSDASVAFSTETQRIDFSGEIPRTDKCYEEDGSPSLLEQVFPVASLPSGDHHSRMPKLGPNHVLELKIRALQDLVSSQKHIFRKRIQRKDKCYGKDGSSSLLDQAFPFVNQPSGDHQLSMPKLGPDQLQYSDKNENRVSDHGDTGGGSDLESLQKNIFCYDECTAASRQSSCEVRIANSGTGKLTEPVIQPSTSTKYPRGDVGMVVDMMQNQLPRVGMVVNMMQNLSEVLLAYCCTDEVAPKEQDHVVIKQVIQNLETCLERVGTRRPSPRTQFPQCDMSKCSENPSDADKEIAAGGSQATPYSLGTEPGRFQATSTEIMDVKSRRSTQNASGGKKSFNMDNSRPLPFPSGGSELEQDDMTKGIKIILEENFSDEEEEEEGQEPHNMLYKNLWLEAEAALCSVNYKARYARMKLEMEKYKQHQKKGELIDVEKLPSSDGPVEIRSVNLVEPKSKGSEDNEVVNVQMPDDNKSIAASHPENMLELKSQEIEDGQVANVQMQDHIESTADSNPDKIVESKIKETKDSEVAPIMKPDHCESSTGSHTENLETSVMARFHILKSRINSRVPINKEGQQRDSVHAGTQEASSHPGNMQSAEDIVMKPQQPKLVNPNFSDVNPLLFMSENSEVDYSRYMDQYNNRCPSPFIRGTSELNINPHMDHFSVKQAEESPGYLEPIRDLAEFCAMQSARSNSSMDQYCGGDYDSNSPSSDWEHVLKEGTWPA